MPSVWTSSRDPCAACGLSALAASQIPAINSDLAKGFWALASVSSRSCTHGPAWAFVRPIGLSRNCTRVVYSSSGLLIAPIAATEIVDPRRNDWTAPSTTYGKVDAIHVGLSAGDDAL